MATKSNDDESLPIYYKSNTDFEYIWYKGIFIKMQDTTDKLFRQKPYALVYSQNTFDSEQTLNSLTEQYLTKTITVDFFKQRLKRAFEIIETNMQ
jgi:hypothetical protein